MYTRSHPTHTTTPYSQAREQLALEKGDAALEPYNTGYMMAGDVAKKMDPFFPFEKAIEQVRGC